jgi:hypothetical protein
VAIGEEFKVVVTCAVYEGDNAQVVPDESRLGVASIQMAPFEIIGGSHPPDVHRNARRFFQYDYQLRIIGPDAIGHDVNIPPLSISYRIHSRVGAAATLEGRDLSYLLPMMPIKVLSLVPADASDIRDASEASLGAVESLRSRSRVFSALTYAFGALAAAMVVLALVPLARRSASTAARGPVLVRDRLILHSAIDSLKELRSLGGWTDDTIAAALSIVRVVAALAIGVHLKEKPAGKDDGRNGRMQVRSRRRVAVISAVTANDIRRARGNDAGGFSATRLDQLDGLQNALDVLTAALYRREPVRDDAMINGAVDHALALAQQLHSERTWIKELWARR